MFIKTLNKPLVFFVVTLTLSVAVSIFSIIGTSATISFNQALNSELASVTTSITPKPKITTPVYQFPRTLKLGSTGPDVKALQIYLNSDPITQVATKGAGSPNNETTYYGPATSKAVSKLQLKYKSDILTPSHLTQGTGYFGPSTLKKINSLLTLQPSTLNNLTTTTNPNLLCPNGNTIQSNCTQSPSTVILTTVANITTSGGGSGGSPSVVTTSGGGSGTSGGGSTPVTPPSNYAPPAISTPGAIITPGSGFTGVTPQPANQGDPSAFGYADDTMARWDVVPYQTFSGNFNVGVVAFHNSGIDHVSFSVNNGPWTNVSQMSANPQTANTTGIGNPNPNGVVEYWATLRASDFIDGPIEVRAIAYPKVGVPRVLDSLYLNTNANGTLPNLTRYVSTTGSDTTGDGTVTNPFVSIRQAARSIFKTQGSVDGGTIYLEAGSYPVQSGEYYDNLTNTNAWLTITHAPGLSLSDVTVTGTTPNSQGNNDGLYTKLIAISGVTETGGLVKGSAKLNNVGQITATWYDDVSMIGPGRTAGVSFRDYQTNHRYITNSSVIDMQDAPDSINIWRNSAIQRIAQSGYHNSVLVINCSLVDSTNANTTGLHPDVYQFTAPFDNSILYGLTATDRIQSFGIRMQPSAKDIAIVNANEAVTAAYVFEMERPYENLLIKDSTLLGGISYENTPPQSFSAKDVVYDNVTLSKPLAPFSGITFRNMPGQSCVAPAITSNLSISSTVNQPFSYKITSSGDTATFNATNLPAGLTFSGSTISGVPTQSGTTNATLSVVNPCGSDQKTLVITINPDTTGPIPTGTITDNFNRPDEDPLGPGSEGWGWSSPTNLKLVSHAAYFTGNGSALANVTMNNDQEVDATFTLGTYGTRLYTVYARYHDSNNYVYAQYNRNSDRFSIVQVISGVSTTIATVSFLNMYTAGGTIRLSVAGNNVSAQLPGQSAISGTLSGSLPAGGQVGFGASLAGITVTKFTASGAANLTSNSVANFLVATVVPFQSIFHFFGF